MPAEKTKQTPQASTPVAANNQASGDGKKSQAWKWILGGCVVIVVLGGLGAAGCTYYVAKKGKTLVNELNNYNYNYNDDYNYSYDEEPVDNTITNTDDSANLE